MGNREAFKRSIVNDLKKLSPDTDNWKIIGEQIDKLSDAEIEHMVEAMENAVSGDINPDKPVYFVPIILPVGRGVNADIERIVKVLESWGLKPSDRVWMTDQTTGQLILSNQEYLNIFIPKRRLAQTLDKKSSIPKDVSQIDERSNQTTGESKGARLSYPELQVLASMGLTHTMEELVKTRGGDLESQRRFQRSLIMTGQFSQDQNSPGSRAKASDVLNILFTCLGFDCNL